MCGATMQSVRRGFIIGAVAVALVALLPEDVRYTLKCYAALPLIGNGGIKSSLQFIDGHYYMPSFVNPPSQIEIARNYQWGADDLVVATWPKSGTHFTLLTALLVLKRGRLPPKTDLHSLCYSPEFASDNGARPLDEPREQYPTHPRVVVTHMPQHHIYYSKSAKYISVLRDPVATVESARRMELLMLGPILTPTLEDFLQQGHLTADGGWLDNVLRWWGVRERPNVLILRYESMVANPRETAERLASYTGVRLSADEVERVVERMSLKWSLENIDPYHYQAITPFSPPDRKLATRSGFYVNASAMPSWAKRMNATQRAELRRGAHGKIQAIMKLTAWTGDRSKKALDAESFFEAHREYFCADSVC